MKKLKEWWFLLVPMGLFAVWLITINTRTFDSAEQKVEVVSAVKNFPTAEERAVARIMDSLADDKHIQNDAHAIKTRQKRYEDGVRKDSLDRIKDSIFIDQINRQTVQIEQIKEEIKNNNQNN